MSIGTLYGAWSLLILFTFAGIVAWVWSGKRRRHFEDAGRIPFLRDEQEQTDRADDEHE